LLLAPVMPITQRLVDDLTEGCVLAGFDHRLECGGRSSVNAIWFAILPPPLRWALL
jgi:hypothetical protein